MSLLQKAQHVGRIKHYIANDAHGPHMFTLWAVGKLPYSEEEEDLCQIWILIPFWKIKKHNLLLPGSVLIKHVVIANLKFQFLQSTFGRSCSKTCIIALHVYLQLNDSTNLKVEFLVSLEINEFCGQIDSNKLENTY